MTTRKIKRPPVPAELDVAKRLDEVIPLISDSQKLIKSLEEEIKPLRSEATTIMVGNKVEEHVVVVDGVTYKAKLIKPEHLVVDPEKLKKKLGAKVYNTLCRKITTVRFDDALLDTAISEGRVSVEDVAECSELVPGTQYIRIDRREPKSATPKVPKAPSSTKDVKASLRGR